MEAAAIVLALGYVVYRLARRGKMPDFKPPINRKEKLPLGMSDSDYLKKVVAERNEKERQGKLRAENQERIKKDFLQR